MRVIHNNYNNGFAYLPGPQSGPGNMKTRVKNKNKCTHIRFNRPVINKNYLFYFIPMCSRSVIAGTSTSLVPAPPPRLHICNCVIEFEYNWMKIQHTR